MLLFRRLSSVFLQVWRSINVYRVVAIRRLECSVPYNNTRLAMTYAYVVILAKPWKNVTNTVVAINTMCYLFLYHGDFEIWELASIIENVGRCGKVTFPGARCFSWNGMATDMSLCALFLFEVWMHYTRLRLLRVERASKLRLVNLQIWLGRVHSKLDTIAFIARHVSTKLAAASEPNLLAICSSPYIRIAGT